MGLAQRRREEPAAPLAPLQAALDQARALEHTEMLRDGGQGDVERRREFERGRLAQREPRQDAAPRGVGQRAEHGIECRRTGGHQGHVLQ